MEHDAGDIDPTLDPVDYSQLLSAAMKRCRSSGASVHDAEDCAQDAIVALLSRTERTRHPSALVSTIAYRRTVDLVRRRSREHCIGEPLDGRRVSHDPDVADVVTDRLYATWLTTGLAELPEATRIVCHTVARWTDRAAAAEILGITTRSIEYHLYRARGHLEARRTADPM